LKQSDSSLPLAVPRRSATGAAQGPAARKYPIGLGNDVQVKELNYYTAFLDLTPIGGLSRDVTQIGHF
jgi:hypothetical protein